ncbi:MAG: ABC transporter ATP-binding protein [Candidatus Dormiibacterota bacterium]
MAVSAGTQPLLRVEDLRTQFRTPGGLVGAVDGVSFELAPGETLGIVGESGSGKSVTALSIMGLLPRPGSSHPTGRVLLEGRDLLGASERRLRAVRGKDVAMVFQDPMTSLDPVMTVGRQIAESVSVHERLSRGAGRRRAIEMLNSVGITHPAQRVDDYPHQFSGGMRQRVMIAMALSCSPKVLIADEPTTALDVTIQAQILQLMRTLQEEFHTAILLITHDMGVVARMADRVVVMYAGRVVEQGPVDDVFYDPLMPYTAALLRSIPRADLGGADLPAIPGSTPSLVRPPSGCRFHPRCPVAMEACATNEPALVETVPGHQAACLYGADAFRALRDREFGVRTA